MGQRRTWKISPSRRTPGKIIVIGPFDELFLADLKASTRTRVWDPVAKAWRLDESEHDIVEQVIARHSDQPKKEPASEDAFFEDALALGDDVTNSAGGEAVLAGLRLGLEEIGATEIRSRVVAAGSAEGGRLVIVSIAEAS